MENITYKRRIITPEWAKKTIDDYERRVNDGKFSQRNPTRQRIKRYAMDIKRGQWLLNPQPIVFDTDGNLIDGQNRLYAVIAANTPVEMIVSRGWPTVQKNGTLQLSTIDAIDRGINRTNAMQGRIHGWDNSPKVVASINSIITICDYGNRQNYSFATIKYILEDIGMDDHIDAIANECESPKQFHGYIVGPLAFYATVERNVAIEFAAQLFRKEGLQSGMASKAFVNWHENNRSARTNQKIFALLYCMKAHDEGNKVSRIYSNCQNCSWLMGKNPKLARQIREAIGSSSPAPEPQNDLALEV